MRINDLRTAMGCGRSRDEIKRTVRFLEDYEIEHFAAEEAYGVHAIPTQSTRRKGFQVLPLKNFMIDLNVERVNGIQLTMSSRALMSLSHRF